MRLAGVFEDRNALDVLPTFLAKSGDEFYGQKPISHEVRLVKAPWIVPESYQGLTPFLAGKILTWTTN